MAKNCIEIIRKGSPDLVDADIDEVFTYLNKAGARIARENPGMSRLEVLTRAGESAMAEKRLQLALAKRTRALNVVAKKHVMDRIERMKAEGADGGDALQAINVGHEGFTGAGDSIDAQTHAIHMQELLGPMVSDLRKAGLLKVVDLRNPEMESRIAVEMEILNGVKREPSGDRFAKQIAEIFVKYGEHTRNLQNKAGAYIRKLPGYIVRQNWDSRLVAKMTPEEFEDFILPHLDESVFDGVADPSDFLRKIRDNIARGEHTTPQGDWLGGFKGPGSLAKRVSQERVLHFKNAESWLEVNRKLGQNSLYDAVLANLQHAARNTATMRTWGTNPEALFRRVQDELADAAVSDKEVSSIRHRNRWSEFKEATGAGREGGGVDLAVWSGATRAWINMVALGKVVLSSLPDFAIRAAVLRHNGVPLFEAHMSTLTRAFDAVGTSKEKREMADLLGVGLHSLIGGVLQRHGAVDSVPGSIAKAQNLFFKANLLTYWTDSFEKSIGLMLSRKMANDIREGVPFTNLPELKQNTLRRYGIDEEAWEVLRNADLGLADGEHFLTPGAVSDIPLGVMDSMPEVADRLSSAKTDAAKTRIREMAREKLSLKVSSYLSDQVKEGLTFGGARERALMFQGAEAGTAVGEALRFMWQFKSFPTTFITKHLRREFKRGSKPDIGGLAHLMVSTSILGYLSLTAKEYAMGLNPRKVEDMGDFNSVVAASILQGGGAGIYGDFLFNSLSRTGNTLVEQISGPFVSKAQKIVDIGVAAANGGNVPYKAIRAAEAWTPGLNLFYARMGMDALFLNGLAESANPGYLRRKRKDMEERYGSTFWLPPAK